MYGKKFKDINLIKKRPHKLKKINLEIIEIFNQPNYSFIIIKSKKRQTLKMPINYFYFLSEEEFTSNKKFLYSSKQYLNLKKNDVYFVFFEKKINLKNIKIKKKLTNNLLIKKRKQKLKEKYWGYINDIFSTSNACAKEIYMKKNSQSSMEFHIKKHESYYIYEGELDLGLRYSRAKQKITKLKKGNIFTMLPGTMHMRMARKNTKIIEMSNKDDDSDSIIVHDGKNYKFKTI